MGSAVPLECCQPLGCACTSPKHHRCPDFAAFLVVDPATGKTHTDHPPAEPSLSRRETWSVSCRNALYLSLGAPIELTSLAVRLSGCHHDTRPSFARAEHLFVTCKAVLGCFSFVHVAGSVLRQRGVCMKRKILWQLPPSPPVKTVKRRTFLRRILLRWHELVHHRLNRSPRGLNGVGQASVEMT